jgi:hypothetical protein
MIDYLAAFVNTNGQPFPLTLAVNATGAGSGDGTEVVKLLLDQAIGSQYALLDAAGLTPDSVTEAPGTSQILEAMRRICGGPGEGVDWYKNSDPGVTGDRVLLLNGQVITISSYTELVAAVYVGDGDNPTASAFYKTSDAGGVTRDTAGAFMVLPDTRGKVLRGLDPAASIDPDGASRDVGSTQLDAIQGHYHGIINGGSGSLISTEQKSGGAIFDTVDPDMVRSPTTDGVNGIPRTSVESRMVNLAVRHGIRY